LGDFQELTSSRYFFWNCHLILIWWIWISLSAGYPRGFPIRVLCSGKEPYFIHGIDCWGCFPEHMRTVDISRHMRTVPFFLFWDRIVGSYTHYVVSLQDPLFSYLSCDCWSMIILETSHCLHWYAAPHISISFARCLDDILSPFMGDR